MDSAKVVYRTVRRRRVIHVAAVINRYDFIDTVVRFADPLRWEMMACTFKADANIQPPEFEAAGIPHRILGVRGWRDYAGAILRLCRLLRKEPGSIVHTHHYYEALIGVAAARLCSAKIVIGRHYDDEIYRMRVGWKRRVMLAFEAIVNRAADAIVVPSGAIRDLLVRRQGVLARKVHVIPYGFDFAADRYRVPSRSDVHAARVELGLEGCFIVGNFGRHQQIKGQCGLLRAFAMFAKEWPDARLLLVGDGPDGPYLRGEAERLGLSIREKNWPQGRSGVVIFAGWRRDAQRLMASVDVVALPSLADSFPQVMVEAMALGRPLIASACAGPLDQVRHGETGLLVPVDKIEPLCEALRWVRQNPIEAGQIGERAAAYVRSELDVKKRVRDYEAVYAEVLGSEEMLEGIRN
jgi:glycosyltransferase involved in cell wall biosynthesis